MQTFAGLLLLTGLACLLAKATADPTHAISKDYSHILAPARDVGLAYDGAEPSKFRIKRADYLADLPGFTRSVYAQDHALIAPESRVWQPFPGWENALTAHLISPANGAAFTMYLANAQADSTVFPPHASIERFIFLLDGAANLTSSSGKLIHELHPDSYAFFPAGDQHRLKSRRGAGMVVFERIWRGQGKPLLQYGETADKPILPVPGEVFALTKLLPATSDYDFNIHIMDFHPGEYLNVKEIHYNQHGLLLLQGKGIYRLADRWYPIQSGDAVWMPPYVIQWYAALGSEDSRYILYKDTTANPALHSLS